MKKEESGRKLKLSEQDNEEKVVDKKDKKKRNKPKDRWTIFVVLFITILVSLVFYFVSGIPKTQKNDEMEKIENIKKNNDFFGSAVHEL